ncbi:MAG: leucine-rich repeat protein [Acutalibacteraceae bacterium]
MNKKLFGKKFFIIILLSLSAIIIGAFFANKFLVRPYIKYDTVDYEKVGQQRTDDGFIYYSYLPYGDKDGRSEAMIVGYEGEKNELIFPNEVDGLTVSYISEEFMFGNKVIASADIPSSVDEIGEYAFAECKNLKKVTIRNSKTKISMGVFVNSPNVVICAAEGSLAQAYANEKKIQFEMLDELN